MNTNYNYNNEQQQQDVNDNVNVNVDPINHNNSNPEMEDIYSYYKNYLIPAITSSLPLLFGKIQNDIVSLFHNIMTCVVHLLIPWTREDFEWIEVPNWLQSKQVNFTHFLLRNLDTDGDGHISPSELIGLDGLHLKLPSPIIQLQPQDHHQSMFRWFQYTFPLMDWKIGIFIWRSCSGLLLLIAIATIIPGRLHVWAGRIFRWPVLLLTYLMIMSELIVYIMVRLFIRLAESIFATKKHRALRNGLLKSTSYKEWFDIAQELDISMGRDIWQNTIDDDSSYRYNWAFINELISDLKNARENDDALTALVVLRQCTRKNVGGVMNEDLFSVTNTGEPKTIVKEFLQEVVITLKWLTDKSKLPPLDNDDIDENDVDADADEHDADIAGGLVGDSDSSTKSEDENTLDTERDATIEDHRVPVPHDRNVIHLLDHVVGPVAWAVHSIIGHDSNHNKTHKKSHKPPLPPQSPSQSNEQKSSDKSVKPVPVISEIDSSTGKKEPSEYSYEDFNSQIQQREQVKIFLRRARAAYGRTALCLSGGAMMGCYHFGHIKALLEEKILPHIISGTSAGSVIASLICTRTDEEIERDLQPSILEQRLTCFSKTWPDRFRNVYKNGSLFDNEEWMELIKWFTCGDLTFEEAYRKTGRILCITLSATTKKAPPVLVNYITAPDVTIASAIVASAAVPGFIQPVILRKKGPDGIVRLQGENKDEAYWDGSIAQDIPKNGLAEMFNCQFFLTAQCNPHIVPFFHNSKGCVAQPSRWSRGTTQDSWRGGFLLAALEMYLKSDMRAKFVFLNELEAAVGFTSTMMTQLYTGTTTIVPQVSFTDYFKLFSNPTKPFLEKCFQLGGVAAYQHHAMMKHHYSIAHALDECLALLEEEDGSLTKPRRRHSQLASTLHLKSIAQLQKKIKRQRAYSLNSSVLPSGSDGIRSVATDDSSQHDDECESGGFDGVNIEYNQLRIKENQEYCGQ